MSGFSIQVGQLPGTGTNDSGNAGNVGELLIGLSPGQTITCTITIASPAVITQTGHGYSNTGIGVFVPTTTGALPTGFTATTTYYTIPGTVTATTFQVATTVANALAGTAVNTSGTQSGTQTGTSLISLVNNTFAVVAAISLTAGDWDVSGFGTHAAVNTATTSALATNASLTIAGDFALQSTIGMNLTFPTNGPVNTIGVPPFRVTVASGATQIVYLGAFDTFAVAGYKGYGKVQARRVR